jgi:UTP--glucose-1-phosphate uridylyltransferase
MQPPVLAQLWEAFVQLGTPILALARVSPDEISRFGCAEVVESRGRLHRLRSVVEKPRPEEAKSDLAIMGRYVLPPSIFPALRETQPGALGEIQLTDGIAALLRQGDVWGVEFEGELLDAGTPEGWLATNIRLARDDPRFRNAVRSATEMAAA